MSKFYDDLIKDKYLLCFDITNFHWQHNDQIVHLRTIQGLIDIDITDIKKRCPKQSLKTMNN
jgi:hypothetical protein